MRKRNRLTYLCVLILVLTLFSGCSQTQTDRSSQPADTIVDGANQGTTSVDVSGITDASAAAAALTSVVLDGTDAMIGTVTTDFSDRDLSGEYYSNITEVDLNKLTANYEITSEGTYVFSGTMNGYQIRVSLNDTEKAQIVLSDAHITSSDGPAIYILSGDKTFITLAEGTENSLTDTTIYTLDDGDEPNACLFSKSDLTINGTGTLTVTGNYNHGIYSKDDLSLVSGTLNVTAVNDAIKGKDFVQVASGTYHLTAGSDGLVSNHADDPALGYIVIQDGDFTITAANDGIQAETLLQIEGGTYKIETGGGSANASYTTEGGFSDNWGGWGGGQRPQGGRRGGFDGQLPDGTMPDGSVPGGSIPDGAMPGDAMPGSTLQNSAVPETVTSLSYTTGATGATGKTGATGTTGSTVTVIATETTIATGSAIASGTAGAPVTTVAPVTSATAETLTVSDSAKGLKAGTALLLMGGTFTLDTSDDCIHTNGDLGITGGTYTMTSGDDGIHADDAVVILAGTFGLSQSYEGIEGNSINIAGGDFDLTAVDDGFNAAGGNDGSAQGSRPGWGNFDTSTSSYLRFIGGTIRLDASGDGLDSNGYLYVEGGMIIVSGPTNSGNGAMDYGIEAVISGGTLVAAGASGMAQNFSDTSTQCVFLVNFDQTIRGGETLTVTDSNGSEILTCTLDKDYQCAVISTPDLVQGETYTVTAGSATQEVTLDSVVTGGGGGFWGGFGGRP